MQELYKHNRHMEQLHIQIIKVWRFLPFALHPARPGSLESVFVIFPVFFGGVDRWPEEIEYCFTKRLHEKKNIFILTTQSPRATCASCLYAKERFKLNAFSMNKEYEVGAHTRRNRLTLELERRAVSNS